MDITLLKNFLSTTGRMLLSENLIIVVIVMWTVKGHFKKLENGLGEVALKVGELSAALMNLETRHSERIQVIEKRVDRIEDHNKQRKLVRAEGD